MPSSARSARIISIIARDRAARGTAASHSPSGAAAIAVAELGGERLADRDQVIAGVEPFGDLADVLAERLAVAQVRRAGERLSTCAAGIVDVVFAHHLVPGELEQRGERIADHRAAAMAHVHRPGRDWPRRTRR